MQQFDEVRAAAAVTTASARSHERLLLEGASSRDEYMIEDILAVLSGTVPPPAPEFASKGYWSLGRTEPHFGAPWASLSAETDSSRLHLLLRVGGSFEHDDDPPQWVSCDVKVPNRQWLISTMDQLWAGERIDYWWLVESDQIEAYLTLH